MNGIDLLVGACEPLAEMTARQREAFVDHVLLGRSYNEIAAKDGISKSAVGLHVKAARQKMARHLAGAS